MTLNMSYVIFFIIMFSYLARNIEPNILKNACHKEFCEKVVSILLNISSERKPKTVFIISNNTNIENVIVKELQNSFIPIFVRNISRFTNVYTHSCDTIMWISDKYDSYDYMKILSSIMNYLTLDNNSLFVVFIYSLECHQDSNLPKEILTSSWTLHKVFNIFVVYFCTKDEKLCAATYNQFEDNYFINVSVDNKNKLHDMFRKKKLLNLNGNIIRVSMYTYEPTSVPYTSEDGKKLYKGFDGEFGLTLTKYMNATIQYISPEPSDSDFGYTDDKGIVRGSPGDVLYDRADMTGVPIYITNTFDGLQDIYPMLEECVSLVVPKATRIPSFANVMLPYTVEVWTLFILSIPILCLAKLLILHLFPPDVPDSVSVLIEVVHVVLFGILNSKHLLRTARIYAIFCSLYAIVMSSAFQGCLSSYLTVPIYYKDINSLNSLIKSGLDILVDKSDEEAFIKYWYNDTNIPWNNALHVSTNDSFSFWQIAHNRNACILIDRLAGYSITKDVTYFQNGYPLLHLSKQCMYHQKIVYRVREKFWLLPRLNELSIRMAEAGLYIKWWKDTIFEIDILSYQNMFHNGLEKLTISHNQTAFYCWLFGVIFSSVYFLLEISISVFQK